MSLDFKSAIFCLKHSPYVTLPNKFTKGPLSVIIHAIKEDSEDAWTQILMISEVLNPLQSVSQTSSLGSLVFETDNAASFQTM